MVTCKDDGDTVTVLPLIMLSSASHLRRVGPRRALGNGKEGN